MMISVRKKVGRLVILEPVIWVDKNAAKDLIKKLEKWIACGS